MDVRQFTALLKNSSLLHSIAADDLQDAANRYPYSSLLQVLLVKKLQLLGETDLDTNLARAALLHADREQLSHFMDRQIPDLSALNTIREEEPEMVLKVIPTPPPVFVPPVVETPVVPVPPVVEKEPEVTAPEPIVDATPEPAAEQIPEPIVEVAPEPEPTPIIEFLSEPILLEDLSAPIAEEPVQVQQPEVVAVPAVVVSAPANEEPIATKPTEAEHPVDIQHDKLSFSQWLKHVKTGDISDAKSLDNQIQAVGYEALLMKEAEPPTKESPIYRPIKREPEPEPEIEPISEPEPTTQPEPETPKKELTARQIKQEQEQKEQEARERKEDKGWEKKVTQMAQKSVAFDDDLVTETLAKIFELQKKYSKALDAYEKLSIRYPEKSATYRAAIDRLKARLG